MIVREVTIHNKSGLHARPATLWVQTASRFQSTIRLKKGDREVDGKSLLAILSLGVPGGGTVQLSINGPDEASAAEALAGLAAGFAAKGE